MKAITARVFRSNIGGCGNGSYTDDHDEIYIVTTRGNWDVDENDPSLYKIVSGNLPGTLKCVPYKDKEPGKVGPMFSGTFAYASDSRFADDCKAALGIDYYNAVPIHDRFETQEQYELLSH